MSDQVKDYIDNLNEYYNIDENMKDYSIVKWGSETSQWLRFKILSEISNDFFSSSLLDLGCGLGNITEFLQQANFTGTYLGLDMLPEMVMKARHKYMGFEFETYNPSSYTHGVKDYCIASGIFTISNKEQMQEEISRMFSYVSKGLGFNSLSLWGQENDDNEFQADPLKTLEFCSKLTSKIVLRHDYLPHDFTVYMYK